MHVILTTMNHVPHLKTDALGTENAT